MAKKRTKAPYATCLNCGANLKRKQKACTSCGRANMARNKAVLSSINASFIAKSAGVRYQPQTAEEIRRERLKAQMIGTPDPVARQGYWYAAHPEITPPWRQS